MASSNPVVEEITEAVIISGSRKGEVIRLPGGETNLTPEELTLLDALAASANQLVESARAAAAEAEGLLQELRQARGR
jgi:hypothetical protein